MFGAASRVLARNDSSGTRLHPETSPNRRPTGLGPLTGRTMAPREKTHPSRWTPPCGGRRLYFYIVYRILYSGQSPAGGIRRPQASSCRPDTNEGCAVPPPSNRPRKRHLTGTDRPSGGRRRRSILDQPPPGAWAACKHPPACACVRVSGNTNHFSLVYSG